MSTLQWFGLPEGRDVTLYIYITRKRPKRVIIYTHLTMLFFSLEPYIPDISIEAYLLCESQKQTNMPTHTQWVLLSNKQSAYLFALSTP